jgi:hypothetical protein
MTQTDLGHFKSLRMCILEHMMKYDLVGLIQTLGFVTVLFMLMAAYMAVASSII